MGILGFIIVGLIAGAIARAILPGKQGGGWIATLVLGVVGGFVGSAIFGGGLGSFWSPRTWILALVGSLIVLVIWGFVRGRLGRASANRA